MNKTHARIRHANTMLRRLGPKRFFTEVAFNGVSKRAKSRWGYLRHKASYAQNCLFIAGLPKSGSTWVSDLLRSLPGFSQFSPVRWNQDFHVGEIGSEEHALYPGWEKEFRNMLAVVKGHSWGTPENIASLDELNMRYLITVRDPRDVIISEYWFVRRTPHHASHDLTNRLSLSEYITERLTNGAFERMTIDWIREWTRNRNPEQSRILRYEDLLAEPLRQLREATVFLGLDVSDHVLRATVGRNSFAKKAARSQGEEDTSKFLRKGTADQWKEVFDKSQLELFSAAGEDVIRKLGYEPSLHV